MEGGLRHGGLLEELLALLFGVKPVSSGTSQVEDASPAMEGTVEQVQDGARVVGDVDPLHAGRNVQPLSYQAVSALVDAKVTVDRCGLDVSHTGQSHLAWLLNTILPVEDVVPVPTSTFRRG